ncbi:hypothetical protein DCC85_08880 [Paenibacillus sp. CAA11]|uniref:endolytic transglycosylase MltG n=1 Tax=Paenibacillus sp. CAA11 TaxID=1532905 RepID=UPI000D3AF5CC|nr:endolytic transglycosylase MltG [Paenibacillus sp. CAA11]AWB44323.1 hypothetical protein DCC85_08880 [Paenibacillus sp. CAA11]
MKNRNFLMGLGAGLIIGAILLQLMNVAQSTNSKSLYTEEQVKQAAESLGLKVYGSDEEVYTEQEWKEKTSGNKGQTSRGTAASPSTPVKPSTPKKPSSTSTTSPATPVKPAEPQKPTAKSNSASEEKSAESISKGSISVKVTSGSTLTDVAARLEKANVISDKSSFIKWAKAKKLTSVIQTGTYQFTEGEDFSSIAKKITTRSK